MAGHSKFKNIMHRKAGQDAKRAKVFSKHIRELTVAAREGGGDPDGNARLRTAIQGARAANVAKDTIERAIVRGAGGGEGESFDEIRYEGYGPGGIAVLVEAMTDNRNRTASEVRSAFTKHGGNLGETGSVSHMFERMGAVYYPAATAGDDAMFEAALEAGAGDCLSGEDGHVVTCDPDDFHQVRAALENGFGVPGRAGLEWKPAAIIPVDADNAEKVLRLIEALDDLDDVQNVYANYDIADEILEQLSA